METEEVACTTDSPTKIRSISREDAIKLCSGQVITSLGAAVKELVENSLDANATFIEVRFKNFGLDGVEIIDNGCGVKKEDFETLTKRHATSKMKTFEDLQKIESFGFRGEALNSLCAMSKVQITTKHEGAKLATRLEFHHSGDIARQQPIHGNVGTRVLLTELFCTLPVRRREFQSNIKREFSSTIDIVSSYCLISRGVKMECFQNSTRVLSVEANSSMFEKIRSIFGVKESEKLVEIALGDSTAERKYDFEGWISKSHHGYGKSSKNRQYFFINLRPCDSKAVMKHINEVYRRYNSSQYPFVLLNVTMDQRLTDINVTPDKRHLLIEDESRLKAEIEAALVAMFNEMQQIFEAKGSSSFNRSQELPVDVDSDQKERSQKFSEVLSQWKSSGKPSSAKRRVSESPKASKKPKIQEPIEIKPKRTVRLRPNQKLVSYSKTISVSCQDIARLGENLEQSQVIVTERSEDNFELQDNERRVRKETFPSMRILGQFNLGFVLTSLGDDLFIVDQHAADEKFNYESLFRDTVIQSQTLVCPLKMHFTSSHEIAIMDHLDVFERNGFRFNISESAPTSQKIKMVARPFSKNADFDKEDIEEMIHQIETSTSTEHIRPSKLKTIFASRACRKSIMIGDPLRFKDMRQVVNNLTDLNEPWSCPHGRPTVQYLANIRTLFDQ